MARKSKAARVRAAKDLEKAKASKAKASTPATAKQKVPSQKEEAPASLSSITNKIRIRDNLQFPNDDAAMEWLLSHKQEPSLRMIKGLDAESKEEVITPAFGLDITLVIYGKDINTLASRVKRVCSVLGAVDREFYKESGLCDILDDGL